MAEVQIRSFVDSMRSKDKKILKELDFGYSWDGQTAILYEIRPQFLKPENLIHIEFAKLRFVKSRKLWKLYWFRASGKWEAYDPKPTSADLSVLLTEIRNDGYGCFFG